MHSGEVRRASHELTDLREPSHIQRYSRNIPGSHKYVKEDKVDKEGAPSKCRRRTAPKTKDSLGRCNVANNTR